MAAADAAVVVDAAVVDVVDEEVEAMVFGMT